MCIKCESAYWVSRGRLPEGGRQHRDWTAFSSQWQMWRRRWQEEKPQATWVQPLRATLQIVLLTTRVFAENQSKLGQSHTEATIPPSHTSPLSLSNSPAVVDLVANLEKRFVGEWSTWSHDHKPHMYSINPHVIQELTGLEKKFSTSLEKQRQQLSTERLSWIKSENQQHHTIQYECIMHNLLPFTHTTSSQITPGQRNSANLTPTLSHKTGQ